jgi:hypothetical protein
VFCVGISPAELIEADAPPASDKAPATPNAVATLLRPLPFEVCFERDIVATSLWLIGPELGGLALACPLSIISVSKFRQLRNIGCYPPRAERLPIGVAHDETRSGLLDGPWRWEAASGRDGAMIAAQHTSGHASATGIVG